MTTLTEQLSTATSQLAQEIELISRLTAFAHKRGRLQTSLWLIAVEHRRNSEAMLKKIKAIIKKAGHEEIDPDDAWSVELLAFQVSIKELILTLREQLYLPLTQWPMTWLIRQTERELVRQHQNLGQARILIMEHDAEVSPLLGERFTSADGLIATLHRDVAI
ncbi:MAG TPA: hypothetical protein P5102_15255 [Candidatus Competibacteraceae bacterium]|nr:hypothetical protein [Candidatus Competibacteraceae bacterium]HRZ07471.1 hypothetical protein [Candidatus Competibacteraceae bacterium]HSA47836.1 hypothetical protein [Candidatus Competibacteraceae bacterium]